VLIECSLFYFSFIIVIINCAIKGLICCVEGFLYVILISASLVQVRQQAFCTCAGSVQSFTHDGKLPSHLGFFH
jgi:hypothetical protein